MDRRTEGFLSIAKFSAYAGLLTIIVLVPAEVQASALTAWFLLVMSGSLRNFVLYRSTLEPWAPATLLIDIGCAVALSRMGYGGTDIIIYFVVISEGTITAPPRQGAIITLLSLTGMVAGRLGLDTYGQLVPYLTVNGAALFFAFAASSAVKREIVRREELARLLAELESTHNELRLSQERLKDMAITEERNRMAREIHDTLAHSLTAIVVTLEAARRRLSLGDTGVEEDLLNAQEQARQGLLEVRESVAALKPLALRSGDLRQALELFVSQLGKWHRVSASLSMPQSDLELPTPFATALYRIVQEASTNAVRHGQASSIDIFIEQNREGLSLRVIDNGCGATDIVTGNGLRGIAERAESMGGTADFITAPGEGFTVQVTLPVGGGV